MNTIRANYVCTLCSQTFTRKHSGKRHNIDLHLGIAPIVRFMDYVIGRVEGRYQPSDPLLYRRRNKIINLNKAETVKEVSPSRFTVIPDKTKESSQNDFGLGHKQDPFDIPLDNVRSKMDGIKETNQSRSQWSQGQGAVYQKKTLLSSYETSSSQYLDRIVKFQEFANLVQRHYSKDTAKELMICASTLSEPDGWIEEKLVFLRNYDKIA
ncbi:MAG: hypothetical protein M3297_00215 [Thermoproteota archaeon]|nr:hypothetical protein [Thermoproteota archaeon]